MTVQEVIDRAMARSRRFVPEGPGATASPTELVDAVQDSLHALFQIAARVNPSFYGDTETVHYSAALGGWPRPAAAEAVERIERADGEEVIVVPMDQRDAEPGFPCVYRWGRVYKPAGTTPGPNAGEALVFYFSRVPNKLVDETSEIDAAYPVSHAALLELDVAIRLAIKDGGPTAGELLQPLLAERAEALQRYVAHLEHETVEERRAYGLVRKFSTNTLVPLHSMLAGGAA